MASTMQVSFAGQAGCFRPCEAMQKRSNSTRARHQVQQRCEGQIPSSTRHLAASATSQPDWALLSIDQPERSEGMSQCWQHRVLTAINDSTKWTVSATVAAVLLWQRNEYAAWCVVGAVLSSFLCKVLKHVLNHDRPDNAPKSDPGMPSSHANSLNFLSVYAALSLVYHTSSAGWAVGLAVAAVGLGIFKTWLRVALGFHTWPQVLVGAALGATTAVAWFKLGTNWVLPALQRSQAGLAALYLLTGIGAAAFGVKNISGWWRERQRHKQQTAEQQQQQQQELDLLLSNAQNGSHHSATDQLQQQQDMPPVAAAVTAAC